MPSFQSTCKANNNPPGTLVVHCSEHGFQGGIHDFLENSLHLNFNYDLLIIPGGPQSLTLVEYLPKFAWAGWKWFRYLVDSHELKRLILIAHQDCGWYKSLPFHLRDARDPRARQEEDLRRVERRLTKDFPGLSVELYFAGENAEDRVTIDAIAV